MQLEDLPRPKIDMKKIDENGNSPLKVVQLMDPSEFEIFTSEWALYKGYKSLKRVGGTGDMARDIVAFNNDDSIDIFQCKHVNKKFNDVGNELLTLLYHMSTGDIIKVRCFYFICLNGISNPWDKAIENKTIDTVWIEWFLKNKSGDPKYANILSFIEKNGFPNISSISIDVVIKEHLETPFGKFRFDHGRMFDRKNIEWDPDKDGLYLKQLIQLFSKIENVKLTLDNLDLYDCKEIINRQRGYFYSAEGIRQQVEEYFSDILEFEKVKKDVLDGIIDL